MKNMFGQGYGQLVVERLPYGRSNADCIKYHLDRLESKGVKINAIFVDSPDHMEPIKRQDTWWLNKIAVYEDLKMLAEQYQVSIFTTRQQKGKEDVSSYSGAGGEGIPRLLDNIIAMDYDASKDMLTTQRKIVVTKARDGVIDFRPVPFRITDSLKFVPEVEIGAEEIIAQDKAAILGMAKPKVINF